MAREEKINVKKKETTATQVLNKNQSGAPEEFWRMGRKPLKGTTSSQRLRSREGKYTS